MGGKKSPFQAIVIGIFMLYILSSSFAAAYFNWQYATQHGFLKWLLLGEITATLKGFVWPYYALSQSTPSVPSLSDTSSQGSPDDIPLSDPEIQRLALALRRLSSGDLEEREVLEVRAVLNDYRTRTGVLPTTVQFEQHISPVRLILEYKYELGESALLSWDQAQFRTTPAFDQLSKQLREIIPSTQFQEDVEMIKAASRRQSFVDTHDGKRFEFSRNNIASGLQKKKRQRAALLRLTGEVADLLR